MIISASRRTDIPAFYSQWFIERIRAGYCTVTNPFNRNQVTKVSLRPDDVDVLVFWTKNPRPLMPYLEELEGRGYRYYFQYTLNGYPAELEPYVPSLETRIQTFTELAGKIGPEKLIWRYDPIILSNITGYAFHKKAFELIAQALQANSKRVVISIVDSYRKASTHFKQLAKQGVHITEEQKFDPTCFDDLILALVDSAKQYGLDIMSCAETFDLRPLGVLPGKCIDGDYIKKLFGIDVTPTKDKNQRRECGCVQSKDIGVYDTCLHGCAYCYAGTLRSSLKNCQNHEPHSPSLIGR